MAKEIYGEKISQQWSSLCGRNWLGKDTREVFGKMRVSLILLKRVWVTELHLSNLIELYFYGLFIVYKLYLSKKGENPLDKWPVSINQIQAPYHHWNLIYLLLSVWQIVCVISFFIDSFSVPFLNPT